MVTLFKHERQFRRNCRRFSTFAGLYFSWCPGDLTSANTRFPECIRGIWWGREVMRLRNNRCQRTILPLTSSGSAHAPTLSRWEKELLLPRPERSPRSRGIWGGVAKGTKTQAPFTPPPKIPPLRFATVGMSGVGELSTHGYCHAELDSVSVPQWNNRCQRTFLPHTSSGSAHAPTLSRWEKELLLPRPERSPRSRGIWGGVARRTCPLQRSMAMHDSPSPQPSPAGRGS